MKKLAFILLFTWTQVHGESLSDKSRIWKKPKRKFRFKKQQLKTLKARKARSQKLTQIDQKKPYFRGKRWLEKNIKVIDGEIDKTSSSIDQCKAKHSERKGSISSQLRDLYMHMVEMNYMKMFLASASFEDLGQKQFLVRQWVEHAIGKSRIFRMKRNLTIEKEQLEEKSAKKKDLSKLQKTESEIQQEKVSKKKLLSMVKKNQKVYYKSIEELEQASKNLETLIKQFKSKTGEKTRHLWDSPDSRK
ncbi:MAG: hypothetical protein R2877_06300 [Bdellovibrionota bacterium]